MPQQSISKSAAAAVLGRAGGKAGTGDAKRRTSAQARAAVNARWAKAKAKARSIHRIPAS